MEVITRESAEADKVKQVVSKDEASASEEAAKVQALMGLFVTAGVGSNDWGLPALKVGAHNIMPH